GGQRDVLRSANFNDGQASGFVPDSGLWSVTHGRYEVAPGTLGRDAGSVFYVGHLLPNYFEMRAPINAGQPTGGLKSNAYLIFDYQDVDDFKFAGLNVSTNDIEIGHRNSTGWIVDTRRPLRLRDSEDHTALLSVNGTTATLLVNQTTTLSYTF